MKKSTKKFVEEDKEKFPPVSYLKSTKKTRKRNREKSIKSPVMRGSQGLLTGTWAMRDILRDSL